MIPILSKPVSSAAEQTHRPVRPGEWLCWYGWRCFGRAAAGPRPCPGVLCGAGALTGCFAVYAVSVCYSYVYLFDEWEAESLNSFSRYMAPLPAAMLLLALGPVLGTVEGLKKRPRTAICAGCAAALLVCAGPLAYWTPAGYEVAAKGIDRQQYEEAGRQCGAVLQDLNAPGARAWCW